MCLTGLVLQSFALLKPVYATIVYCLYTRDVVSTPVWLVLYASLHKQNAFLRAQHPTSGRSFPNTNGLFVLPWARSLFAKPKQPLWLVYCRLSLPCRLSRCCHIRLDIWRLAGKTGVDTSSLLSCFPCVSTSLG